MALDGGDIAPIDVIPTGSVGLDGRARRGRACRAGG